ncbi:MAG: hypothetical protein K9N35_08920 [Candidatus Marinimicrobia bacterium]|nr:hypothetical protein [Candidatus Neomarinimicrobiota bacterium]
MINYRFRLTLLVLLGLQATAFPQKLPTSDELNSLMLKSWSQIEDYEVDIKLALNIPGFRMPTRNVHYLYKAPDKSKVEVKGFAIVPKQGIQPFFTFLKDSLSLTPVADTTINGRPVFEILLEDTFMNQAGQVGFYIDQMTGSIYQAWAINEGKRFFNLESEYLEENGIALPATTNIQMIFPPDFKNIQRLGKRPTEMKAFEQSMNDEWLEGSINIQFSNYKVNQGIPDYRFEDEATDKIQE